jgi:hypothetical protein
MVMQFKAGDIVKPVIVNNLGFSGVVREVDPRINKVWVAWGNGAVSQHDPDEVQLLSPQDATVKERMASGRRVRKADAGFFADGAVGEGILGARRGRTAAAMTFDALPEAEKAVARKMAAKGYAFISQVATVDGDFGKPLYFKSLPDVGPFLRSFPDYKNAKMEWVLRIPQEFYGSDRTAVSANETVKKVSERGAAEEFTKEEGPRVATRRGRL